MSRAVGTKAVRVLVADDDADQRRVMRHLFAQEGFDDLIEAEDGAEALRLAVAHQPDLIVLDLAMPVRSGVEVLPDLNDAAPQARVVVVSNFPRSRLDDIVRRRGAVGYVEKRVAPERLIGEILMAAALTEQAVSTISGQFAPEKASARSARHFVRDALGPADQQLVQSTELLVSELVTNAVVHASSAPRVDVRLFRDTIRVEVYDDDPTMPQPRSPLPDVPGGRGLLIVAQLARRWGAEPCDQGKVVWFELDRSHRPR